ncbi:hypothetical protein [Nonomuraea sp. SYSU D8015]|uniref:hypothetical protein n=1 Tax=Nonomuraea sp. SYSU D8015 TaxID=2593644 RepID=UPI00166073A9|nr:hypothetical protein [Nonomuraea sp. SYSU D8015]
MPISPRAVYSNPDMWNTFGHSYLQFTGGSVDQTGRFDAIFRAMLDIEYTNWRNRAVSGAQLILEGRKLGGFGRVFQECGKNTGRGAPYTADGGALLMCYGINDLGGNGTGPSTFTALRTNFIHTMRACISLWRAARVWDNTSASGIAYGAGFTQVNGTSNWSFGSSTHAATALTNANFTITLPSDYAGEPVVICFDSQSTNGGTVTFGGTAGVTGTFSVSNINNVLFNHSKAVKRITNLTAANAGQTITVTVTQLDSGGTVAFDCWWLEAKAAPPIIVCNVARLPANGYAIYTNWTGTEAAKDAEVVALNGDINALVAEFDAMVQVADIDSALNKTSAYFWDGLHPNELGSAKCADACMTALRRMSPTTEHGIAVNFNVPSPRQGAVIRNRITGIWYAPEHTSQGTAGVMTVQTQYWLPWIVSQGRERYIQIGIPVTTGGTTGDTIRWGIYDDVGWLGYPQNLVTEVTSAGVFTIPPTAGVIAASPTSGTGSLNITLDPGLYWLSIKCITHPGTQAVAKLNGPSAFQLPNVNQTTGLVLLGCGYQLASQGTGALADVAPALTPANVANNMPALMLKLF